MNKNILVYVILLAVFSFTGSLVAKKRNKQYFNQSSFEVDFTITHPIIVDQFLPNSQKQILILGVDENQLRVAALYSKNLDSKQYQLVAKKHIPENILAFDILTSLTGVKKLLMLNSQEILTLDFHKNLILPLSEVSSFYLKDKPQFVARKDLVKDVNNDGVDDIVIPSFTNLKFLIGNQNNEFNQLELPIQPNVDISSSEVSFSEKRLFFVDANADNKVDVVEIGDSKLIYYQQLESGLFSPIANELELPIDVGGLPWWYVRGADGEQMDQSQLKHKMVEEITDINGDNIADLMIRQTESSGVLDKKIHYDIHYGSYTDNKILTYKAESQSQISADGTLTNLRLIDLNKDDRKEVLVSSFDIGVSQIIGALLSGSIDQDVFLFRLEANGQYSKEPLFSEEVDLNFSLSSGRTGQPVILSSDLDGDGLQDLVLSVDEKRLKIFKGTDSGKLFESRSKRHKLRLPKNGSLISSADLDGDNKEELIVRYGKQDKENLRSKVVILSAK